MRFVAFVFWLALGPAQQTTNGSVEGHVFRTGTTEPVEGVRVTFTSDTSASPEVFTDKEGHFSFSNVMPGRYTVRIQRDGYLVRSANGAPNTLGGAAVDGATVATVTVGAGQRLTSLTYFLIPGGTISGRIVDPQGSPAAAARISAMRLTYQEGRPMVFLAKTVTSNDRGEYRMFWMEPGEYYIRAEKPLPTGFASVYYPGSDNVSRASKVRVSEGAESPRIDISLQRLVSFTISGSVTSNLAGVDVPLDAAQFYLIPVELHAILDRGLTFQSQLLPSEAASGKFLLSGVQAGRYDLVAVLTDRESSPPRSFIARIEVDVPFRNVSDVNMVIAPGVDLSGKVVYSGTSPLPSSTRVQLRPKGLFSSLPLAANLTATPAEDGTFTIPNLPNFNYSVSVVPLPPNTYITDIRQGSFSVFDTGTVEVAGRLNRSFEIVLDSPGATINGKVPASQEQLAAGVTVTLVPDERRRENLALFKRGTVSADGSFSFSGIAPGRYKLFAWESVPPSAEQNADFMEVYRDDGTEITVVPGDTSSVQLRLIPK